MKVIMRELDDEVKTKISDSMLANLILTLYLPFSRRDHSFLPYNIRIAAILC